MLLLTFEGETLVYSNGLDVYRKSVAESLGERRRVAWRLVHFQRVEPEEHLARINEMHGMGNSRCMAES